MKQKLDVYGFIVSNIVLIVSAIMVVIGTKDPQENPLSYVGSIGALIGGIGTFFTGVLGERRTRLEVASSNAAARQAVERAEEARKETEQIRERLAWRRLTPEQLNRVTEVLLTQLPTRHERLPIWIDFISGDPESYRFYRDIKLAFERAGVETDNAINWTGGEGVLIRGTWGATQDAVARALVGGGGIPATTMGNEELPDHLNGSCGVHILIGSKHPPPPHNYHHL